MTRNWKTGLTLAFTGKIYFGILGLGLGLGLLALALTPRALLTSLINSRLGRNIIRRDVAGSAAEVDGDDDWRPPTSDAAVRRSSTIGGSQVLDCDVNRQQVHVPGIPSLTTERIMTLRRPDKEVPIFIQFNGYPPHIDKMYQVCSALRPPVFAFGRNRARKSDSLLLCRDDASD